MYELAKKIVCSIIAAALSTSVSIVQGLLPLNPQWLERVSVLAAQLRATSHGRIADDEDEFGSAFGTMAPDMGDQFDVTKVLAAHQQLWDFTQAIKAKGLGLDEDFCDRIEREWSVSTLLTYLRTADRTLQDSAGEAQQAASRYLLPDGGIQGNA